MGAAREKRQRGDGLLAVAVGCSLAPSPSPWPLLLKHLNRVMHVRIDAELARDLERLLHDVARADLRVVEQGARGSLRIRPTGPDGDDAVLGLQHVAVARDD